MYTCVLSRSEGAGRATTRNTRWLTRSVIALIVPPLPAPSRPSNTTMTRKPLCLTQSWSLHSSACSRTSSFSYSLRFNLDLPLLFCFFSIRCFFSFRYEFGLRLALPILQHRNDGLIRRDRAVFMFETDASQRFPHLAMCLCHAERRA